MKKYVNLTQQFFRFVLVGCICFIIDFSIMLLLTHYFKINYIFSCGVSFATSTIFNYILSMKYVFNKSTHYNKQTEILTFFIISVSGLFITELLMITFIELLLLHYTISKVFSTIIVMLYNFILKKFVFEKDRRK